jgi:hypothetical protein
MEKQKKWEALLEWASVNDENRQKAVITASKFILLLSLSGKKELSQDELKAMFAGSLGTEGWG